MITELMRYRCKCCKCGHLWETKTVAIPKACSKCHRVTWNEDWIPSSEQLETLRQSEPPKPADDKQAKLKRAREALMSIGQPKVETVDHWQGWTEPAQSYDDQTGEMRTFRRHIKSGRVQWLDSESYLSGV